LANSAMPPFLSFKIFKLFVTFLFLYKATLKVENYMAFCCIGPKKQMNFTQLVFQVKILNFLLTKQPSRA
jgi:hypothetical protein